MNAYMCVYLCVYVCMCVTVCGSEAWMCGGGVAAVLARGVTVNGSHRSSYKAVVYRCQDGKSNES